jgi:hypothetical protein
MRYPNQFFDLSQQYIPSTIKELFKWCTFYYYNSPLIGAAMKKVSRYPITDLILDDHSQSTRDVWDKVLNRVLKIKDRCMEVNLDYHVYGNAFVSLHLPFTRFLICRSCKHRQPITQWKWNYNGSSYNFNGTCGKCGSSGQVDIKDVSHKDLSGVRLVRWNPENMHIKFNEYTGRYVYMYTVPAKLRAAINRGDRDILEDIPLIVLEGLKQQRMIRFHPDSILHLKAPTLAEQDQGWGKPAIMHVLKDMFYFYTLRRAQEAIAMEHIIPFDLIYPMPNAQQDPYVHTDLASWRNQIQSAIEKHRRDPNYKAVIPIPVGFGRLGGDGKAMMLGPELQMITQSVVGGMGIPQEFLFGGLNFSGSSVSLRTLENDFIQNRTQLLDMVNWIKDKLRVWMSLPNITNIRFADFRMADDIQRNQQLIGLNAQGKVSDQTLLTELGYDYEKEVQKRIEEIYVSGYLGEIQSKSGAKAQGEAGIVQSIYQNKIQEMQQAAQEAAQKKIMREQADHPVPMQDAQAVEDVTAGQAQGLEAAPEGAAEAAPQVTGATGPKMADTIEAKITMWANKLSGMGTQEATETINHLKMKMPEIGAALEARYRQGASAAEGGVSMAPLPEQRAPRRQGAV